MKSLKYFAGFIIFPFVMYLFSLLRATSGDIGTLAANPADFAWSLVINITVELVLSSLTIGLIAIVVHVDILKIFMFGIFMTIVGAFCLSSIDNVAVIGGQNPMATSIFWIIKIIVGVVVLIAGFKILVGGADFEVK